MGSVLNSCFKHYLVQRGAIFSRSRLDGVKGWREYCCTQANTRTPVDDDGHRNGVKERALGAVMPAKV